MHIVVFWETAVVEHYYYDLLPNRMVIRAFSATLPSVLTIIQWWILVSNICIYPMSTIGAMITKGGKIVHMEQHKPAASSTVWRFLRKDIRLSGMGINANQ